MPSNTTPPSDSPITSLYLSDTFYAWHTKTNDLITKVNPIEVYSITAGVASGIEGITLSDDGYGNYTIGYALPATIPNDHTFSGDINFQAGISGHVVNTFNGDTGAVEGTATISGYANGGTPDFNVEGAIFSINGVTGTSFGACTIDGSDIPNTIGNITGPAGYIITSVGTSMTNSAYLFSSAVSGGQTAFRIDPINRRVAINSSSFATSGLGAQLYVKSLNEGHGIKTNTNVSTSNDIWLSDSGTIAADNQFNLLCGYDGVNDHKITFSGATSGATYGAANNKNVVTINPSAHIDFEGGPTAGAVMEIDGIGAIDAIGVSINTDMADGAHDVVMHDKGSIYTENGFSVFAGDNDNHTTSGPQGIFHVIHGATYGGITSEVFTVNEAGAIGVKASSDAERWGNNGYILSSQTETAPAKWIPAPTGGGGGGGGDGTPIVTQKTVIFDNAYDMMKDPDNFADSAVSSMSAAEQTFAANFSSDIFNFATCPEIASESGTLTHLLFSITTRRDNNSAGNPDNQYLLYSPGESYITSNSHTVGGGGKYDGQATSLTALPNWTTTVPYDVTSGKGVIKREGTWASPDGANDYFMMLLVGYVVEETQTGSVNTDGKYWEQVNLTSMRDLGSGSMVDVSTNMVQDATNLTSDASLTWTTGSHVPTDATHVLLQISTRSNNASATLDNATENFEIRCNPGSSSSGTNRHQVANITNRSPWTATNEGQWGFDTYLMPVDDSGKLYFNMGSAITYYRVVIVGYAHYVNDGVTSNFKNIVDHTISAGPFETAWPGNNSTVGPNQNESSGTAFVSIAGDDLSDSSGGAQWFYVSPDNVTWNIVAGHHGSSSINVGSDMYTFLVPSGWYYKYTRDPVESNYTNRATVMW